MINVNIAIAIVHTYTRTSHVLVQIYPSLLAKTGDWVSSNLDTNIQFTICEIVFGITITGNSRINTINFLILIGKLFINKSRTNKQPLYFINFLALLKDKNPTCNISKANKWPISRGLGERSDGRIIVTTLNNNIISFYSNNC